MRITKEIEIPPAIEYLSFNPIQALDLQKKRNRISVGNRTSKLSLLSLDGIGYFHRMNSELRDRDPIFIGEILHQYLCHFNVRIF